MTSQPLKKQVLVVDDSKALVMCMTILLKRMGFDVIPAGNGAEALRVAKLFEPDLITLDMDMPVLSGMETLEKIKQEKLLAGIPVIMMSGNPDKALMEQCKVLGCSFYLTKPVNLSEFNEAIQTCLFLRGGNIRKHLRATYTANVKISHNKVEQIYQAQSLSEHGLFVLTSTALPVGSLLKVTLGLDEITIAPLGHVIYIKEIHDNDQTLPGMAIEFKDLASDESMELKNFIFNLLMRDIVSLPERHAIFSY